MSSQPYTSRGVCAIQINRNACDGTPLTVADGDTNVILLSGAGDATELELGKTYNTIAAQSDGPCWSAPGSKEKTGDNATLRHCSTTYLDVILTMGNNVPNYDADGNICGFSSPKNGTDASCCPCGSATCVDGEDFSIVTWSCPLDCNNNQLENEDGEALWDICVITSVADVTEAQNRRKSNTPSNNRVDYNFELEANDEYGFGPGDIFIDQPWYDDEGEAICTAVGGFLGTTPPPAVGCPCDAEYQGQFVTAAKLAAGTAPTPIGD